MKNTITHLIDKISFQAQTTILVWIIVIGFTLIASVGLLALMGIKSEFDINSSQSHNMYTLTLLNKAYDIHKNDQILPQLLEIWEQYKTYNLPKDQNSTISHLREWYAKTFKMHYYQQIQRLLSKENALIESIDKAFINDEIGRAHV